MFANIVLLSPPFSILTYKLPEIFPASFWKTGQRVIIPVGKRHIAGYIQEIPENFMPDEKITYKTILWPLDAHPVISREVMDMANFLAHKQGIPIGSVLGHTLPVGLRAPRCYLKKSNALIPISVQTLKSINQEEKDRLIENICKGIIKFTSSGRQDADEQIIRLEINPPWPLRPAAKKQIEILDFLFRNNLSNYKFLVKSLGKGIRESFNKLLKANFIQLIDDESAEQQPFIAPADPPHTLTQEQLSVLEDLKKAFFADTPEFRLLHGVTGSGKTSVYLELAKTCLMSGKSVLLLAPEVALAYKLYSDARKYLPDITPVLYHGYQTPKHREKIYEALAREKNPVLVIGTRSCLFLPVPEPGCVILDEEHDSSYKQDENLVYHAKELSWHKMMKARGLLVLGSATPDLRAYYASNNNLLPSLKLLNRVSGNDLPEIEIARLDNSAMLNKNGCLLNADTEKALLECMERGEQAVILLNRRGYAPQIFCTSCTSILRCPNCHIGMSYHKASGRLVCHYCDYNLTWPSPCPVCGNNNFLPLGEGTERIAEHLEAISGRSILRLDRDAARNSESINDILTAFSNGKSPFLVGTQMLSKGHHFPNVTLVVAADGDTGLNLPDYRAAEKTFQLFTQCAGRAGRGVKKGRAIIQTRNPEHYCWKYVKEHDYNGFYAEEINLRKKYLYPPFIHLALIRISFLITEQNGFELLQALACDMKKFARSLDLKLLGPAPSPINMLKGRKRYQCLIKSQSWQTIRELWNFTQTHKSANKLRLSLDMDPVNMM